MSRKDLKDMVASVRARLLRQAKESGEDFQATLSRYVRERLLPVRLVRREPFLADVRRIGDDHVEAASFKDFRKRCTPVEGFHINRRLIDAVADADAVVEIRQHLATLRRLDLQAELANLYRLFVEVHAEQIVEKNVTIEIKQRTVAAQLFEPVIRSLIGAVELVEGFDQKRAAATGRIKDTDARQLVLPSLPEAHQCSALRTVEAVEVVSVGINERLLRRVLGFSLMRPPQLFRTLLQRRAECLLDDVAGDERRRVTCFPNTGA